MGGLAILCNGIRMCDCLHCEHYNSFGRRIHSHSTPLSLLRWTMNCCLIARYDYYINVFIFGRETKVDQCIHNIRPLRARTNLLDTFRLRNQTKHINFRKDESVWRRTNFRMYRFCCFFSASHSLRVIFRLYVVVLPLSLIR